MPLTIVECVPDVEESTPRDSMVNESASSNNQLNDVNKTKHQSLKMFKKTFSNLEPFGAN